MCAANPTPAQSSPVQSKVVKPRRRRLAPEERAARRRKQHRELVARGRARTRDAIGKLRDEEAALQTRLTALISQYVAKVASSSMQPVRDPRRKCVIDAILEQAALEAESVRLDIQIRVYEKIQDLVDAEQRILARQPETFEQFLGEQSYIEATMSRLEQPESAACDHTRRVRHRLGEQFWNVVPVEKTEALSWQV